MPGAVERTFPNCPRYVHCMALVEHFIDAPLTAMGRCSARAAVQSHAQSVLRAQGDTDQRFDRVAGNQVGRNRDASVASAMVAS
jgi:hypothetical protein